MTPAAAAHRPQLDALRALAVLPVLLVHFWPALPSFGQEAVRLFFVISGFLITSQLLDGRAALVEPAPAGGRWRVIGPFVARFVARRALRLFPSYYLMLVLLALANAPGVRRDFVAHAAYGSNLLAAARDDWGSWPTAHLWTLATEEQFYLLWPWLVVLLPLRVLPLVTVAAIALAPAVPAAAGRHEPRRRRPADCAVDVAADGLRRLGLRRVAGVVARPRRGARPAALGRRGRLRALVRRHAAGARGRRAGAGVCRPDPRAGVVGLGVLRAGRCRVARRRWHGRRRARQPRSALPRPHQLRHLSVPPAGVLGAVRGSGAMASAGARQRAGEVRARQCTGDRRWKRRWPLA